VRPLPPNPAQPPRGENAEEAAKQSAAIDELLDLDLNGPESDEPYAGQGKTEKAPAPE
jgi:hypothetical protein